MRFFDVIILREVHDALSRFRLIALRQMRSQEQAVRQAKGMVVLWTKGMHVAGTGQEIVPPDFLKEYRPDALSS